MAKSAARHKKLDFIGTIVAYQPFWSNGFPLLVTVGFNSSAAMNDFAASSAVINYIDDDHTTSSWQMTSTFPSQPQQFIIGANFTAIDPKQTAEKPKKQGKRLHGTGNGTIIFTDAVGPHNVSGSMRLVELKGLDTATFLLFYDPEG
jgi:hypothetical protein